MHIHKLFELSSLAKVKRDNNAGTINTL